MSNHPAEGTARPESGLTDDDFSPIWADDDRPRIPRVASACRALATYLESYRSPKLPSQAEGPVDSGGHGGGR